MSSRARSMSTARSTPSSPCWRIAATPGGATWCRTTRRPGRFFRRCSRCSSSPAAASCGSCSRVPLRMWRSCVTPLAKLLEAALFASGRPLPASELAALDPTASADELMEALDEMRLRYDTEGHGIELVELGGGWQILTRPEYTETIERAQLATRPARLSAAALETLAIVAYRQPIGRAEIEEIRGVAVGGMLRTLLEGGLIDVVGRAEGLGRPL